MLKNEEEFNNFMHRATEVHDIVKKMASDDKELIKMGMTQADIFLDDKNEVMVANIEGKDVELKVTSNRTMINKVKEINNDPDEQTPDGFMKTVELDAKKRYEDKKVRREKSDTLKVQANKAFRRGEYEKSLSLYNKAINFTRDSCVLYTNRALTYMQLQLYPKAIKDCETALIMNENSLKAHLFLAHASYKINEFEKCDQYIQDVLEKHGEHREEIEKYVLSFKTM